MKEFIVSQKEKDLRFDSFLVRLMPNAGKSFLYKMLRKKNIVLNDKKAEGNEKLKAGDCIKIYFTDETFEKFAAKTNADGTVNEANDRADNRINNDNNKENNIINNGIRKKIYESLNKNIIYEDEDVIVINKPAGILSQKSVSSDISVNDFIVDYVKMNELQSGNLNYKPSVCNRLDRNTSGIILAGKTLYGTRLLSEMIRERDINKYYLAVCNKQLPYHIDSFGKYSKNEKTNTAEIIITNNFQNDSEINLKNKMKNNSEINLKNDSDNVIHTEFWNLFYNTENNVSLALVKLYTGKSHQIRAHLKALGFEMLGDRKYSSAKTNQKIVQKYKIDNQLLHSFVLEYKRQNIRYMADIPSKMCTIFKVSENQIKKRAFEIIG